MRRRTRRIRRIRGIWGTKTHRNLRTHKTLMTRFSGIIRLIGNHATHIITADENYEKASPLRYSASQIAQSRKGLVRGFPPRRAIARLQANSKSTMVIRPDMSLYMLCDICGAKQIRPSTDVSGRLYPRRSMLHPPPTAPSHESHSSQKIKASRPRMNVGRNCPLVKWSVPAWLPFAFSRHRLFPARPPRQRSPILLASQRTALPSWLPSLGPPLPTAQSPSQAFPPMLHYHPDITSSDDHRHRTPQPAEPLSHIERAVTARGGAS